MPGAMSADQTKLFGALATMERERAEPGAVRVNGPAKTVEVG